MAQWIVDDVDDIHAKVEENSSRLFQKTSDLSHLVVSRISRPRDKLDIESIPDGIVSYEKIHNIIQLNALRISDDCCQIFMAQHDRCWEKLNITRELFQGVLDEYRIFSQFWNCVFTFGERVEENEFQFPAFRARHHIQPNKYEEFSYVLRQAELNNRREDVPWSIRQTGVYHAIYSPVPRDSKQQTLGPESIFFLLCPTKHAKSQLDRCLQGSLASKPILLSWNVHRILVADSLRGWMDYMANIEEKLRDQTNKIMSTNVLSRDHTCAILQVNFDNRQDLKCLEDLVMNLELILPNMRATIMRIRDRCHEYHEETKKTMDAVDEGTLYSILQEFNEYVRETDLHVQRATVLRNKIASTGQLIQAQTKSSIVIGAFEPGRSYINEAAHGGFSTRDKINASIDSWYPGDTSKLQYNLLTKVMQERSTKDAAAVKILTVITLVYLPTTIVANFFSTEFVQTNDNGHMTLTSNWWLLVAISIPLTAFTIILWWSWVRYAEVVHRPQQSDICRERQSSFGSFIGLGKTKNKNLRKFFKGYFNADMQGGKILPQFAVAPASLTSPVETQNTWSSTATTAKSG
ncbi:hypothetical protein NHQ30_009944 [Ciborinia camelliae]|nr:hypothetical protein NHQ30_009944 [Ciborinia camelliae]